MTEQDAVQFEVFKTLRNRGERYVGKALSSDIAVALHDGARTHLSIEGTREELVIDHADLSNPPTAINDYVRLHNRRAAADLTPESIWALVIHATAKSTTCQFCPEISRRARFNRWSVDHRRNCVAVTVTINSWTYILAGDMTDTEFNINAAKRAVSLHNAELGPYGKKAEDCADPASPSAFDLA